MTQDGTLARLEGSIVVAAAAVIGIVAAANCGLAEDAGQGVAFWAVESDICLCEC
jgi:hypothetical protein